LAVLTLMPALAPVQALALALALALMLAPCQTTPSVAFFRGHQTRGQDLGR